MSRFERPVRPLQLPAIPGVIDSHCHLSAPEYADDLREVLQTAKDSELAGVVSIGAGYGAEGRARTLAIAREYPGYVWPTLGIHPHEAEIAGDDSALASALDEIEGESSIVAIGEIGLDFFYDYSSRRFQIEVFRRQLEIAERRALPVIIHCRNALDELLTELTTFKVPGHRVLMHCFSDGPETLSPMTVLNPYVSFSGIVTFPKSLKNRAAASLVPADRLLVETDGPYLAPQGFRGKRNEPALTLAVVKTLAEMRGRSPSEIADQTTRNARAFFSLNSDSVSK